MKDRQADKIVTFIVQEFKAKRKNQGLSHETLAQKAGLHRSTISLIENGKRSPSLKNCTKIANALGFSLGKLLIEAEKKQS